MPLSKNRRRSKSRSKSRPRYLSKAKKHSKKIRRRNKPKKVRKSLHKKKQSMAGLISIIQEEKNNIDNIRDRPVIPNRTSRANTQLTESQRLRLMQRPDESRNEHIRRLQERRQRLINRMNRRQRS